MKSIDCVKRLAVCVLLFSAAILNVGCATPLANPSTAAELEAVREIVVVPADVFVGLSKFASDDERMTEIEEEHKPVISDFMAHAISENGYSQVAFDFEAYDGDHNISYMVTSFKEELAQSMETPNDWVPLGESTRELARVTNADALLYVSYEGIRKSGGEVAKDIGTSILIGVLTAGSYIPVSAQNSGVASAYLIDGISGDILWKNSAVGGENATLVEQALSKFPSSTD